MIFTETELKGAYIIEPERLEDKRGFFARAYCSREFEEQGLKTSYPQCNISFNNASGTLRGMHYQAPPYDEAKLVRCTRGAIYDVIIDLRDGSPTRLKWVAVELNEDNSRILYVPEGFAHGFQTLADASEVFYQISQFYTPAAERGVRYNDPAFGIDWPDTKRMTISEKDAGWPDFVQGPAG